MLFEDFASAQSALLWATFAVALVMGMAVTKTNFCTMGAVSDIVNIGDSGRMRAWFFAIAIAMLGVTIFEATGLASVDGAFPPYRGSNFIWAENLFGGIMFGIGMTFASGCGNKTLIRIGGGNIKSIFVLCVIAVIAYFMVNPFPGSDKTLMSVLFIDGTHLRDLAVSLSGPQDIGSMIAGKDGDASAMRLYVGLALSIALFIYVFKSADFRKSFDNVFGGLMVGLAVLAGWYLSANIGVIIDGEPSNLRAIVEGWDFIMDEPEGRPATASAWSTQSFTFINPMGQSLGYAVGGFEYSALTFGLMALFGVIAGAFIWSVLTRSFRIEWFVDTRDFFMHLIGAILMGFGGVLALGCTIGQGITGVSTVALGSIIALAGIIFGSAITMKIQYYKLCYDEEATFMKAFLSSLVDFKMLPAGMRKLEAL